MKFLLTTTFILSFLSCYSQFGKRLEYIEKNGVRISKGDTLQLGEGAGINGQFLYLTLRIDGSRVNPDWAFKHVLVEKIIESNITMDKIFYITVKASPVSRFIINDIELAIKKREVIFVNSIPLE